jgi:hypothetical protein
MRRGYEKAHYTPNELRTLYEEEAVQDKIRDVAARLYKDNPAIRSTIREAEELLLPSVGYGVTNGRLV